MHTLLKIEDKKWPIVAIKANVAHVAKYLSHVFVGIYFLTYCVLGFNLHHVQGNTTLQVHLWKKRQIKFTQRNNPVKKPLVLSSTVKIFAGNVVYTFIFLHFELDCSVV